MKRRLAEIGIGSPIVDRGLRRPLHTGRPGTESLPKDLAIVPTFNRLLRDQPVRLISLPLSDLTS